MAFFCGVCMENRPVSEAVTASIERCTIRHPPFCKRCTETYLSTAVSSKRAMIKCMSKYCDSKYDAVCCRDRKLVAPDVFQQWCDLLCESSVLGYYRCYCPNVACNELIIDECAKEPAAAGPQSARRIGCPNCKTEVCFRCFSAWSDDHRCSVGNENDDAIIVVEREGWMQCPGCKNYVERSAGCGIIRCRCYTEFCYHCGQHANHWHLCYPIGRRRRPSAMVFTVAIELAFMLFTSIIIGLFYFLFKTLTKCLN